MRYLTAFIFLVVSYSSNSFGQDARQVMEELVSQRKVGQINPIETTEGKTNLSVNVNGRLLEIYLENFEQVPLMLDYPCKSLKIFIEAKSDTGNIIVNRWLGCDYTDNTKVTLNPNERLGTTVYRTEEIKNNLVRACLKIEGETLCSEWVKN